MACCETPSGLAPLAPRADSHVNFTKGMVLGVDDYRQEYVYHSGALHWLARETLGYGVTTGLKVMMEPGTGVPGGGEPVLRVAAGSALLPSGRMVCVGGDQCAQLNAWLAVAANAAAVEAALVGPLPSPPASPPTPPDAATITLHVILSHHECLTLPVPIPGEPCRAEEDLMAPSRVTDDYRLELSLTPPPMREYEAAQEFAAFMGSVAVDGGSPPGTGEADWRAALEDWAAAAVPEDGSAPPPSPPPSPPGPLTVAATDWPAFAALAQRFWTSEVRPRVIARCCRCPGSSDDDRLLLASLEVPVIHAGTPPADQWQVDSAGTVTVDESVRATLPSLQLVALIGAAMRAA